MTLKIAMLGGIGPLASAKFHLKLIMKLQESGLIKSNAHFPQIILNSIPAEELTGLSHNQDLIPSYILGIQQLAQFNPDFIAIICNTAHVYLGQIRRLSEFQRILSLRALVYEALKSKVADTICVLGTPLTIKSGLYKFPGISYLTLDDRMLEEIAHIINKYSTSGDNKLYEIKLQKIIDFAKAQGATLFLSACTEISLLLENSLENIIDTLQIMQSYVFDQVINSLCK